jgi:hypothetical protein
MEKRNLDRTAKQKEFMIKALEANYGDVRMAAKLAKISSQTHYRWRKEDKDYEKQTDSARDICYRDLKEHLISQGLKMVDKGDTKVLNKMMGIFLKDLPEEMRILRLNNDIPLRATVRFINTPVDPRRTDHLSPEERKRIEGK